MYDPYRVSDDQLQIVFDGLPAQIPCAAPPALPYTQYYRWVAGLNAAYAAGRASVVCAACGPTCDRRIMFCEACLQARDESAWHPASDPPNTQRIVAIEVRAFHTALPTACPPGWNLAGKCGVAVLRWRELPETPNEHA